MIRYALNCSKGHEFEAWFRSGQTFARQAKRGEIRCPECGSPKVKKAIMAPAIGKRGAVGAAAASEAPEPPKAPAAEPPAMHVAGKLHEALQEMRRYIEKNADYVGPRFAAEARKMHSGDSEARSIYGEASEQEAEALREEGIEFGRIPWPKHKHDA
jgi:hypothetical protein